MVKHPIEVTVTDDLERSRATVFFRLILGIPLFIWLGLWGIAAFMGIVANWFLTLFGGRSPEPLYGFLCAYVRFTTHVYAYMLLAADPYPGFSGAPGYPVDVEFGPSELQNRWKTFFRAVLAVPALWLAAVLIDGGPNAFTFRNGGVALVVAGFAWFAILVRGRMPQGFRDLIAYCLRYAAQTYAYCFLLTDRYPDADPAFPAAFEAPAPSPVWLSNEDDPRRSRLTVFFRLLLALPHIVWLELWAIAAVFALIAMWVITVVRGRPAVGLHRFLSAFVRYGIHVYAFVSLVGGPFPGFNGRQGSYPVDVTLPSPGRQGRWGVFFRLVLAVPALIVEGALFWALFLSAFFCWWASLITGREPVGLQRLGAFALRYVAQTAAYTYLLTDRYPFSGPGTLVVAEQLSFAE